MFSEKDPCGLDVLWVFEEVPGTLKKFKRLLEMVPKVLMEVLDCRGVKGP